MKLLYRKKKTILCAIIYLFATSMIPLRALMVGARCRHAASFRPPPKHARTLHIVAVKNRGRLKDPWDTPYRDGNRDRCG